MYCIEKQCFIRIKIIKNYRKYILY